MGPHHARGDRDMLPFMVNMARLYELFVAEWLKANLPAGLIIDAQHKLSIDEEQGLHFKIDLMLSDAKTGAVRCVLDTKYKGTAHKDFAKDLIGDLQQIVAYAEATGCREAILIYPKPAGPFDRQVGDIRVRTLAFSLDGDLEQAGQAFLQTLLRGNLGEVSSQPLGKAILGYQ